MNLRILNKGIKSRVIKLVAMVNPHDPQSVRAFCVEHGINYKALYNAFKSDKMGAKTIDAFKKAVPDVNMNWFLYEEGAVFMSHKRPNEDIKD